jgi:oligopeptide/dipeptide ABC transporter ATP-binding protein
MMVAGLRMLAPSTIRTDSRHPNLSMDSPSQDHVESHFALLNVENLSVEAHQAQCNPIPILDQITFKISTGQSVGILGESGCGKTSLARALIGILPPALSVTSGSIALDGEELIGVGESILRRLRGDTIAVVHQEAEGALHPLMSAGDQIAEILRAHRPWNYRQCRTEARGVLQQVFSKDSDRMARCYPHELSGGQRQRVLIAQAIACGPKLLIADEPTASLDLTTQSEIISLLYDLKRQHGMALVLISHHPSILRELCDRIIVMYAGRIVEHGSRESIFADPLHPYTRALLAIERRHSLHAPGAKGKLAAIPGTAPDSANLPSGCVYESRCDVRISQCTVTEPGISPIFPDRGVRCVLYEQ